MCAACARMQFVEDAGPLAHPVRPSVYREINNFYTATVYEKGAEVVRMIQTLLGVADFRKGMDLYFARHDGEAATVEAVRAMLRGRQRRRPLAVHAAGIRRPARRRSWCRGSHDARAKTFRIEIAQTVPPTPGQPTKEPMLIPLAVGLVGRDGRDLPLKLGRRRQRGARHPVSAQVVAKPLFSKTSPSRR